MDLRIGRRSESYTYININDKKHAQIGFYSKRPHKITKMNDNINSTIQ